MPTLTIDVHGLPAPQGSKRAFVNRHTGRAHVVETNHTKVMTWRDDVKAAAIQARQAAADTTGFTGAVAVVIDFYLPRPKGHYRTGRNAHLLRDTAPTRPAGKPDVDKLVRSTFDALTAASVWPDDRFVVDVVAGKYYAIPGEHRAHVGAQIRISEAS